LPSLPNLHRYETFPLILKGFLSKIVPKSILP
jgi:hypothetical protein